MLGPSTLTVSAGTEQAAPAIHPAIVERPCTGVIAGVRVRGQVDLVDIDGIVIDSKTASKSPSCISADYQLQLITYTMLIREPLGPAGWIR